MQDAKLPELLTVKQAATLLQVSVWTIRRWINAKCLTSVRIGKEYQIVRDSISQIPVVDTKICPS
jgi:excisionase family DNA binding protein